MIGRLIDDRYEVRTRIARGGMATVYRALDRRLDRIVALKIMHPHLADAGDVVARFRREARAAARLSHPGIVAIYDQGVSGEVNYLVMEYVDGTNLRTVLRRLGSFSTGEALDIGEQVLDALARAHRSGVVHRDVKPENVLMPADGRIKVADFGLARAVTEATAASTGTVLGTVAYLAPEILTSGASDSRADVYATGVMLYELIAGHQPFPAQEPIRVAYQHVHDGIPPISGALDWIPSEVDDLISAFTTRDVDDRPSDAAAALELLRRTRTALSPEQLARSADVPPQEEPAEVTDEHATEGVSVGGTVALPIGAITTESPHIAGNAVASPRHSGRSRSRLRRVLTILALVVLITAGGAAAWWFTVGPGGSATVPELIDMTEDEAVAALQEVELYPEVVRDHHDEVPQGVVWASDPEPGTTIRKGSEVTLTVSLGVLRLTVPQVVGEEADEARRILEEAGLDVGEVTRQYDEEVPAGDVISASADAGDVIEHYEPVDLLVSQGRQPVDLTSVANRTREDAQQELEDLGLTVEITEEHSDTVAAGNVIRQSPSPDDGDVVLYRGDEVEIVVSLGPQEIEVPDVVTLQLGEARRILEDAGFVVQVEEVLGGLFNTVRSMSPGAGEMRVPGTVIVLTIV